jgi:hypothetical protein
MYPARVPLQVPLVSKRTRSRSAREHRRKIRRIRDRAWRRRRAHVFLSGFVGDLYFQRTLVEYPPGRGMPPWVVYGRLAVRRGSR